MYTYKDRELTKEQVDKLAAEKGVEVDVFLTNNPDIQIQEAVVETTEPEGKTAATEKDTSVDAIEVSKSTESPLDPGSSGFTKEGEIILSGEEVEKGSVALEPVALEEVVVTAEEYKQKEKDLQAIAVKEMFEKAGLEAPSIMEEKDEDSLSPITEFEETQRISADDKKQRDLREKERQYYANNPDKLSAKQSVFNSITNSLGQLSTIDDRAKWLGSYISSDIDLIRNLFPKETADKILKSASKNLGEATANIDKVSSYGGKTIGFTELSDRDSLGSKAAGGLAATFNALSAFGTSAATNYLTFGVGLATDMIGGSVKSYNETKAADLGITVDQLIASGNAETLVPASLGALGYSLEKAGIKSVGKYINSLSNKGSKAVFGLMNVGNKEGTTEWFQATIEKFNENLAKGMLPDEAGLESFKYMLSPEGRENYYQGFVGGSGIAASGSALSSIRSKPNKERISKLISDLNVLEDQKFAKNLTEKEISLINESQNAIRLELKSTVNEANELLAVLPSESIESINKNADLLTSYNSQIQEINKDPKYTQEVKDLMISELVKKRDAASQNISDVRNEAERLVSNITRAKEAAKDIEDLEFKDFANAEEIQEFLKTQDKDIDSKASGQQGFIIQDKDTGKQTIVINREIAAKEKAMNIAGHELGHAITYNTIKNSPETALNLGEALLTELNKIDSNAIKDSNFKKRMELYANESKEVQMEEALTLFSDALATGDVQFKENIFTKIGDQIRRVIQSFGVKTKFNTGRDVYNFIKDYNKSLEKGKLSKSQLSLAQKGAEGELVADKVQTDEQIIKESRSEEASTRVQELYDTQGEAAAFDIIEQFKPITSKIVEKRSQAPGFDRQLLTDEIETGKRGILDLVREYDAESGVPLAAYINKFLPARAIEASKRILGEEFTDDVTEAKGVAAEEVSVDVTPTDKSTTSKLRRVLGIKQDDAIYDLAKEVSGEILSGDLPGKKVKTAINKEARKSKLRKAVSDLMGTEKAIDEQFLNKNILEILKALPASDLVKLEREAKVKVLAEQGPRLNVKDAREAVNKGLLPKDTNLQSGPKVSSKLPTTLEQAKEFFTQKRKAGLVNVVTEMLVKDAAPEVTKDKMEPAKRAKVLSEIDRAPTLKFSISETSQAKDVNASGKIAGIKGKITINDNNRLARQIEILKSIIEGKIPTVIFEAGRFGNFGRWNRRGKIVQGKFIPIPKIGTKYFKTKDGTLIKENSKEYKKAVEDGNFLPGRGGLYYGVKDPAYIEARDAAKKNDKLYPNLKKPKRVNMINAFTEAGQAQSKANMDTLETMANVLAKAVASGTMTKENAALFIASSYQATTGLIKIAAPFKYKSKIFEYGLSGKQRKGDKYREEHNPPASVIGSNLIWAIANNKVSEVMPSIRKNFNQTQLSKKDDEKIDNAKLDSTLPIGTTILDNPVTRIAASGINLNSIINVETGKTLAEENGVGVETKFENNLEVYTKQNELILKINSDKNFTVSQAKKQIDQFVKVAPSITKASKSNNDKSAFKYSKAPTNKVTIETAATTDEALNIARDLNAPVKKIRVFDFDDTLAQTKSDVLYIMPDGTEGKLNAEQFANDGSALLSEGAVFDFSEFNKVTEGKKGPLFKVAQTIAAKRGTEDVFVLTARAPESQLAIYEFLKSQGLDIPLKNITGLGNSTGEAKARWIVDKAADGYNDFYFADDAPQNVKAVKDALSVLDVKSKTQQAKIKFSKSLDLNKDFNDIIENKTGIASDKTYARVKAEVAGANKGRFNFFIPPSAEDFVGLLYSTLGKGDVGTAQMAWYKAHLLNPFARAMENLANDRVSMMQDYRGLKKALKIVPKDLRKKIKDSNFTKEQAVRVAIWDKQGMSVPGLSQKDQKELVDYVNADAELTVFAEQLVDINKGDEYASPDAGWVAGTIDTDFIKSLNTTKRSKYLETWQQNANIIFSEANLNKLEAAYGKPYRVALENMLHRMKTGRNRSFGTDTITSRFTDWLTNSVGAIMFFNTRSAVLQTISAVNFINFTDNNVLKAGQAFANQPQYWSDFKKLFNSPFLLDRRSGIKLNVNEADIAEMAKGPGNSARNVVAGLLKLGFLPTQIADSFAIASGGATFYRNRIKALKKEGLTEAEAEEIAFRDFREIAEESQQSSRPDKISQQQAGPLGRIVLAFANTPAQYARLIKKAASDLKNGRGDAKTNISKIIYYGVAQNLLFSALQQALFAIGFGDDDEEEEKRNEKYFNIANGMADSILRGIGVGGAVVSVVKNTAIRLAKEADKKAPKYQDAVVKGVLQISPPVSSKVGKLQSAGRSFSWNQKEMKTMGFNIDNPAYLASAQVISAATNVPLDRAIKKITNIKDAGNENIEYYKRVALALGWSAWELGIKKDSKGKVKKVEPKTDMDKLYDLNKKQQIDSLLSLGISKKQIKALKLEEDRVNAILNPKSIKQIKVSKRDSLFGLNKKDQVKALEKLGLTKKEIRALRLESDRVEAIINKQKKEVE